MAKEFDDKLCLCGAISAGIAMGGIRLSMAVSSVLFVVAILCTLIRGWKSGFACVKFWPHFLWIPIVVFVISLLPSYVLTQDFSLATKFLANTFIYRISAYFVFLILLWDKPRYVMYAVIISMAFFGVEATYAYYTHFIGTELRAVGFNSHSPISPFTTCICLYMVVSSILALEPKFSYRLRIFGFVIFVLSCVALVANDCRTGFVTAMVLFLFVGVRYFFLCDRKKITIAFVLIGIFLGGLLSVPHYRDRIMSIGNVTTNASNVARISMWHDACVMWKDHPVAGVGLCSWRKIYKDEYYETSMTKRNVNILYIHCHSNYFMFLAESGVIGLIGFLIMLGGLFYGYWRMFSRNGNPYAFTSMGIVLVYGICGIFDYIIYFPTSTKTFWYMLGAMTTLAMHYERSKCELRF